MGIFNQPVSYMGVDIGSSSIKIVEVRKEKDAVKLANYGFSENGNLDVKEKDNLKNAARVIKLIREKSGINCQEAIVSLPTFSVFTSVLHLSNVNEKDLDSAIHWEAKKVIPLPLDEMIISSQVIEEESGQKTEDPKNFRVLLTGAPNALVKKYIDIFKELGIGLKSLETETFSLIRVLSANEKSVSMLVDFGAGTTDITIVDNGIPMLSRSVDIGGLGITKAIASHLNIGLERAEQFKYDLGITQKDGGQSDLVPKAIIDALSPIVNEIKYALALYENKSGKKTERVILSGGSALLPKLTDYLHDNLQMEVIVGDPWAHISCQVDLKPLLDEIGPRLAVAAGLAVREIF